LSQVLPAKRKPVYVDPSYYQKPKTEKERVKEKIKKNKTPITTFHFAT